MEKKLLEVNDLYVAFNILGKVIYPINGISFSIKKNEILGIVGESGSGKSTIALSIMQLLQKNGKIIKGSIKFNDEELIGIDEKDLQKIRGAKIALIPQNPMNSFDPVYTIESQMKEILEAHDVENPFTKILIEIKKEYNDINKKYQQQKTDLNKNKIIEIKKKISETIIKQKNFYNDEIIKMLTLVGISDPKKRLKQYPHELSGGMLQRIMIAMNLLCKPDLLIADEPTTALDVTIQMQILELLKFIQKKMQMSIILITHDLGVISQMCNDVIVMYAGRVVEKGNVNEIFNNPKHEYTKGLLNSIPKTDDKKGELTPINGNSINLLFLPNGCSFAPRCDACMNICLEKYPINFKINDNHEISCFKYFLDLYKEQKINDDELNKLINESEENNKFKVTFLDVLLSLNDYLNIKNDKQKTEKIILRIKKKYLTIKNNFEKERKIFYLLQKKQIIIKKINFKKQIEEIKKKIINNINIENCNFSKDFIYDCLINIQIINDNIVNKHDIFFKKNQIKKLKINLKNYKKQHNYIDNKEYMELNYKFLKIKNELCILKENYKFIKYADKKIFKTKQKIIAIIIKKIIKIIKNNKNEILLPKYLNFLNEEINEQKQKTKNIYDDLKQQKSIIDNIINNEELQIQFKKINEKMNDYLYNFYKLKISNFYKRKENIFFKYFF